MSQLAVMVVLTMTFEKYPNANVEEESSSYTELNAVSKSGSWGFASHYFLGPIK